MRLTTFTGFGLRALMRIASDPDHAWSTVEIADEFVILRHHLTKMIAVLANAGILKPRRGGGATLAQPSDNIRLADVVRLLEKDQALVECFKATGNVCAITPICRLRRFLRASEDAFLKSLDTLADCTLPAQIPDFIQVARS